MDEGIRNETEEKDINRNMYCLSGNFFTGLEFYQLTGIMKWMIPAQKSLRLRKPHL